MKLCEIPLGTGAEEEMVETVFLGTGTPRLLSTPLSGMAQLPGLLQREARPAILACLPEALRALLVGPRGLAPCYRMSARCLPPGNRGDKGFRVWLAQEGGCLAYQPSAGETVSPLSTDSVRRDHELSLPQPGSGQRASVAGTGLVSSVLV